ncbi:MAG: winged helix DNA-binding domain-containing protein [Pyrinomonadaceae bacterium]|nr:winged helix DNA-binding domain-containing protein [Pyrinomonadaceae bacterium]
MARLDIARQRLHGQRISKTSFRKPHEVVSWLVAVQAQDYAGAKWALGLRMQGATDDDIDQAFADGSILRTHLMRPTWHFVTPADIRWMLKLTAPRVHAANAFIYRQLELDGTTFKRSNATLTKALRNGKQLTRDELRDVLKKAGIAADDRLRLAYIMMYAELTGVVCSGARRGKQFTYALLDERAPHTRTLEREEALAELAGRYFVSRGPATVQDFAKWSGLTVNDARCGLEMVKAQLRHETIDSQGYWLSKSRPPAKQVSPTAQLLPIYDEYISGYKDRSAIGTAEVGARLTALGNDLNYIIVIDGRIVGAWKRTLRRDEVIIQTNLLTRITKAEHRAISEAAQRYGDFVERPVRLASVS